MTIKTSDELVKYIRHHIAGSHWQDVRAVEDFVAARVSQRLKTRMELIEVLLEGVPIDYSKHERLRELLHDFSA